MILILTHNPFLFLFLFFVLSPSLLEPSFTGKDVQRAVVLCDHHYLTLLLLTRTSVTAPLNHPPVYWFLFLCKKGSEVILEYLSDRSRYLCLIKQYFSHHGTRMDSVRHPHRLSLHSTLSFFSPNAERCTNWRLLWNFNLLPNKFYFIRVNIKPCHLLIEMFFASFQ